MHRGGIISLKFKELRLLRQQWLRRLLMMHPLSTSQLLVFLPFHPHYPRHPSYLHPLSTIYYLARRAIITILLLITIAIITSDQHKRGVNKSSDRAVERGQEVSDRRV
jgi:hypothetical protein